MQHSAPMAEPTPASSAAPCPVCGATNPRPTAVASVHECGGCGALYGICTREQASRLLDLDRLDERVPVERWRRFELQLVKVVEVVPDGQARGYYDIKSGAITQRD